MTSLLRAEALRLFSRRFTWVALLVVLLALGAYQIQVNDELTPPSAAEVAQVQASFDETHQDWVDHHAEREKECVDSGGSTADCAESEPQLADWFATVSFAESATTSAKVTAYVVALAVFMVAGSYVGAEYSSGSLGNWLSFIPRRRRVYAAKVATIVGFGALAGAVLLGLTVGAAAVMARIHGTATTGLAGVAELAARGLVFPVVLGVFGLVIGFLARHTAAAIGVLLGYLVVWFVRNLLLREVGWAQRLTPWTPEANLSAVLNHGHTYEVPVIRITADGPTYESVTHTLTLAHGVTYWSVALVVAVLLAGVVFSRRDVA